LQQVGSYLGYTGGVANVMAKTARYPEQPLFGCDKKILAKI